MNTAKTAYLNPVLECNPGAMKWTLFLAIFTTLAVGLPYLCHQFGLAGMIFLPLHFAVLTAALVMGLRGGVVVALAGPVLSYSISAMPPAHSLFPITVELVTYAVVANIVIRKFKMPAILSLAIAMIAGRLVSIALVCMVLRTIPFSTQLHYVFITGIPGILIQLALIPPLSAKVINYLGNR